MKKIHLFLGLVILISIIIIIQIKSSPVGESRLVGSVHEAFQSVFSPNENLLTPENNPTLENEGSQYLNTKENNITYADPIILQKKGEYDEGGNQCGKDNKTKKEALFVLTGIGNNGALGDVWKTLDGVNWTQIAKTTKMGSIYGSSLLKVNNVVYMFGSVGNNNIYKSTDLINWDYIGKTPITPNSHFDKIDVEYFDNKFVILSKVDSKLDLKVWTSPINSINWKEESNINIKTLSSTNLKDAFGSDFGPYVLNNKLWYTPSYLGPIFISSDNFINWKEESVLNIFNNQTHYNHTNNKIFLHQNKAWIVSNQTKSGAKTGYSGPFVMNTENGKDWVSVTNIDKNFIPGRHNISLSFNNKIFSIGNEYSKGVWSSVDGSVWKKMDEKGITGVGPADRHSASGVTLPIATDDYVYTSVEAPDLRISINKGDVTLDRKIQQKNVALGTWDFEGIARDPEVTYSGEIKLSGIGFMGTDRLISPKFAPREYASSLEPLRNIRVYLDGKQIGYIAKFTGPFYDKVNGYALTQMVDLSTPITLKQGQVKKVSLTADLVFPSNLSKFTTYLSGFSSMDTQSDPCTIYNSDPKAGYGKYEGLTIFKNPAVSSGGTSFPPTGTGLPTTGSSAVKPF